MYFTFFMKELLFFFFIGIFGIASAQVTPAEKAALLAFYNATDGPNWVSENDADLTNDWDFTGPVTDDWFGITINGGHVTGLDLNLTNDVAGSNNLAGIIPNQIGDLQWLTILDLAIGELTGPIPLSITTLTDLHTLNLFSHNLSGTIPPSISNLTELQILFLSQNQFTGEIPLSITTMSKLNRLQLRANNLSSEIPIEITNMSSLSVLQLGTNQFTGFIYPEYGNLTNLTILEIENNLLTGEIPSELGNLTNLIDLRIGTQDLTGTLPVSLRNLVNARQIHIQNTLIDGEIPTEYEELSSIIEFLLHENQLTGVIPDSFGNLTTLERLDLRNNQLTGAIPNSFSSLNNLRYFAVSNNQLVGSLSPDFATFINLETIYISDNQLEGVIPDFSTLPNFRWLIFNNNQYQFGDFENQFDQYNVNLSIFNDNPQAKVNDIEILDHNIGEDVILTTTVSGAQNHYTWYKDGVLISGAPDSATLTLNNVQTGDAGVYHAEITSDIVTDLTLVRNNITLSISCTTPKADDPEDVITCESYPLPPLSVNNFYYTDTNAGGTQLKVGDEITTSQTLYVYTGTSGCSDENEFDIQIDRLDQTDNTEDVVVCENYTLPTLNNGNYFTESNGTGTELFPGDILEVSQTVYIYSQSGSCANENSFTVTIDSISCEETPGPDPETEVLCKVDFPNFFTPNNDGVHDRYVPITDTCSPTGTLSIYNRYAQLVFQTNSLENTWDGTFNGKPLPSSDYWYRFISTENNEVITGHFSLKR